MCQNFSMLNSADTSDFFQNNHFFEKKLQVPGISVSEREDEILR